MVRTSSSLALVAVVLGAACAQGSGVDTEDGGDDDGGGGDTSSSASDGGAGTGGSSTGASSAGGAGNGSSSGGSSSSGSPSGSSSGGSSSGGSGSGGDGGGAQCPPMQHFCAGVCTGNTPQTGCYGSVSCAACVPPAGGTSTCTAQGTCDFTCQAGYQKVGNSCQCSAQCCTNADCAPGETCSGGVCMGPPPPPCDNNMCFMNCVFQMMCGGTCLNNVCTCLPCP